MTNDTPTIAALRAALEDGPTPGPWRWEFNRKHKSMHIVGGRPRFDLTVMDFARWGMNRAVVLFRDVAVDGMNIMHRLCDRPDWIAPFPGRAHHADWCADITHPDARLMVAARNAAPDLLAELDRLRAELATSQQLAADRLEQMQADQRRALDFRDERDKLVAEVAALLSTLSATSEAARADLAGLRDEVAGLRAFRDYFADRCESLFYHFGMEPVDLFNEARAAAIAPRTNDFNSLVAEMAIELKAQADADAAKAAEHIAAGRCPDCEGEGQQGGQFCGGYWTCEMCGGSGRAAAITKETK